MNFQDNKGCIYILVSRAHLAMDILDVLWPKIEPLGQLRGMLCSRARQVLGFLGG